MKIQLKKYYALFLAFVLFIALIVNIGLKFPKNIGIKFLTFLF